MGFVPSKWLSRWFYGQGEVELGIESRAMSIATIEQFQARDRFHFRATIRAWGSQRICGVDIAEAVLSGDKL